MGASDERARAFFAVELDAPARGHAAEVVRALRDGPGGDDVRWVRAENLHVTLRFLGDVARSLVPELAAQVRRAVAKFPPFALSLGAVRDFPSPRRPRVVAMEVAPVEELAALAAAIERGVVAAGLEPETRPFRAHLTLGRLRGRRFPSTRVATTNPRFEVAETVLFESELGPGGSRYTPLERCALGG